MRRTRLFYALLIFVPLVLLAGFTSCRSNPSIILPPPTMNEPDASDLPGQWAVYVYDPESEQEGIVPAIIEIRVGSFIFGLFDDKSSKWIGMQIESERQEVDGWYIVSFPADPGEEPMSIKFRFKDGDVDTLECNVSPLGINCTLKRLPEPIDITIVQVP